MPTESSPAASPSSHSISSARRPWTACQYVSATTATPAAHPAAHAPFVPIHELGSRATTCRTPGSALALSALTRLTRPPSTGERSIEATSIPGTFTSIPKTALPSTLLGVSAVFGIDVRSEEHTSELQSLAYLVCRLLLEKKKKKTQNRNTLHSL